MGAGPMGREWLRALVDRDDVEVVGLVDLDEAAARAALDSAGLTAVRSGVAIGSIVDSSAPDFVVDVTAPAAHRPVTMTALSLGLPVLGEKPLAATLAEALELVAAAEAHGRLFMVGQSRRYEPHAALRRLPRRHGPSAAAGHGGARVRRRPVVPRRRPGRGVLRGVQPELELVPGRGRGVGDVRDDDRRAVRLHRKLVQPRPRDLVERHVRVADVLAAAHEEACRRAVGPVRDRLRSWTTLPPAAA